MLMILPGVFAQQTVRPDANNMTRLDYDLAFGNRASQKSEAVWMSMVCSMIRRSAWKISRSMSADLRRGCGMERTSHSSWPPDRICASGSGGA